MPQRKAWPVHLLASLLFRLLTESDPSLAQLLHAVASGVIEGEGRTPFWCEIFHRADNTQVCT